MEKWLVRRGKEAALLGLVTLVLQMLACAQGKAFMDWKSIKNPILTYPHWSIKDAAMAYRDGTFYIFFSAFYQDRGMLRSHVVEVSTRDFKHYSDPILNFDGREEGWVGMCSPDVERAEGEYVLTFNSWGDPENRAEKPGRRDSLFYRTSKDLVHWSGNKPLAANLTAGQSVIDAALAPVDHGEYLIWKERKGMTPQIAFAPSLEGRFTLVGNGHPVLLTRSGKEDGLIHENYQFVAIEGTWYLLTTDYSQPPHGKLALDPAPYLYRLAPGSQWLKWTQGYKLKIPVEPFNTDNVANAAALYDWRKRDGYYYLLYAGRKDEDSYAGRGWNSLGLARSRDLVHWTVAGADR